MVNLEPPTGSRYRFALAGKRKMAPMRFPPHRRLPIAPGLALLALIALVSSLAIVIPACSKSSSNPYAPMAGGGGAPPGPTESFDSGVISTGSFSHTFANAGDFGYHCTLHGTATSGMRGSVHVATGLPATATVSVANFSFTPTPANIGPGGTVTWVWGGTSHSVTTP